MIESVLNLGIKGADLVISQLEKIQENKEKFSRPSSLSVTGPQNQGFGSQSGQKQNTQETKGNSILKSILDAIKKQKEVLAQGVESRTKTKQPDEKKEKPGEENKNKKETDEKDDKKTSESVKQLQGAVQGLATLSSGNAIRGVAGLAGAIPVIGDGIVAGSDAIVTALEAFRANVESAAKINYDTQEARSKISNFIEGSKGGNFTGRNDLDLNTQKALAQNLAEKFGTVTKPLQDAIRELYKGKDGKNVDINQAASLASGNFTALGNDKGFFLQKISDQLQGLPPSMRQAMQTSLLQNVGKDEQSFETSTAARSANTRFDNEARTRAAGIMDSSDGKSPVENAIQITNTLNKLDSSLNKNFDKLLTGLGDLFKKIPGINIQESPSQTRIGRP
jgi:hypothetical protein